MMAFRSFNLAGEYAIAVMHFSARGAVSWLFIRRIVAGCTNVNAIDNTRPK